MLGVLPLLARGMTQTRTLRAVAVAWCGRARIRSAQASTSTSMISAPDADTLPPTRWDRQRQGRRHTPRTSSCAGTAATSWHQVDPESPSMRSRQNRRTRSRSAGSAACAQFAALRSALVLQRNGACSSPGPPKLSNTHSKTSSRPGAANCAGHAAASRNATESDNSRSTRQNSSCTRLKPTSSTVYGWRSYGDAIRSHVVPWRRFSLMVNLAALTDSIVPWATASSKWPFQNAQNSTSSCAAETSRRGN